MGAFNTVTLKRLIPCVRCGDTGYIDVQFKYGDTQQYHYVLGDCIVWGGNDVGEPEGGNVAVLGTPEYCKVCGLEISEEYVIDIVSGCLADYRLATPEDMLGP